MNSSNNDAPTSNHGISSNEGKADEATVGSSPSESLIRTNLSWESNTSIEEKSQSTSVLTPSDRLAERLAEEEASCNIANTLQSIIRHNKELKRANAQLKHDIRVAQAAASIVELHRQSSAHDVFRSLYVADQEGNEISTANNQDIRENEDQHLHQLSARIVNRESASRTATGGSSNNVRVPPNNDPVQQEQLEAEEAKEHQVGSDHASSG